MKHERTREPGLVDDAPQSGFPLSSAQRGIWFAQHLLGDIPLTIAQYIDVHGDLDVDAFADAGAATGREIGTAMLRLFEHDGQPYQVIDPDLNDRATVLDLRESPDPEAAALAWMRAEYQTPLDMLEDRLIVCAILRIADARYFVYTRIHHVVLDGFGATTFSNRIAERYTAAKEGREPASFPVSALHEIVEDENRYRESRRFETDRGYWADRVRDLPHPIGLSGRAAPVGPHPVRYSAPLPGEVSASVEKVVARDEQATFASVVIAAFAAFLARVTGEADIVLSLPVSARTTVKLRRSGGMVSNVVPIRVSVDPADTAPDITIRVQLELTGALRHQRYRHEDMRRDNGRGGADRGFFGPAVNIMMFGTRSFSAISSVVSTCSAQVRSKTSRSTSIRANPAIRHTSTSKPTRICTPATNCARTTIDSSSSLPISRSVTARWAHSTCCTTTNGPPSSRSVGVHRARLV